MEEIVDDDESSAWADARAKAIAAHTCLVRRCRDADALVTEGDAVIMSRSVLQTCLQAGLYVVIGTYLNFVWPMMMDWGVRACLP